MRTTGARALRALLAGATIAALVGAGGSAAAAPPTPAEGDPPGFRMVASKVLPKHPLFDGLRPIKLRLRFAARRALDLRIIVARRGGRVVAAWTLRGVEPGRYKRRWNGLDRRGRAAPDGRYEFRVGPVDRRLRRAGRFRLRGHVHPVDGDHSVRGPVGEFGAGRNGGRIHEGYDLVADCGTPLVAARGGVVSRAGFDARLYGHFVRINTRKSGEQHFYSHLIAPPRVDDGERVRTGERIGRVGQTGNAVSTPCHLHFELRRNGRLLDPEPHLRRWDD